MNAERFLEILSGDKFLPDLPDSETIFTLKWLKELLERYEKAEPRTVASVLLERWAKDTEALARVLIEYAMQGEYYYDGMDGTRKRGDWETALAGEIAYLNSAAEVGR